MSLKPMLLGYNTNGFAHHRLDDAIEILAELGFGSVALTLDHHALNPYESNFASDVKTIRGLLEKHGLRCVIETGARFLLDPRHKHQPTLLSPSEDERQRRLDFLCRAVDLAAELHADAVSFWSGTPVIQDSDKVHWHHLVEGCLRLSDHAFKTNVRLAFEPEPGMFVDTMDRFAELHQRVGRSNFGLTLDVGHLHCLDEGPIADHILRWREVLWNVHIEDMRRGVHDHLMFGAGEMDFPPILAALRVANYAGGVHVELSRHSHDAVATARAALACLRQAEAGG